MAFSGQWQVCIELCKLQLVTRELFLLNYLPKQLMHSHTQSFTIRVAFVFLIFNLNLLWVLQMKFWLSARLQQCLTAKCFTGCVYVMCSAYAPFSAGQLYNSLPAAACEFPYLCLSFFFPLFTVYLAPTVTFCLPNAQKSFVIVSQKKRGKKRKKNSFGKYSKCKQS